LDSDEIAGEIDARKRELFYLLAVMVLLAGALYRILHFQILNPVNHLVKGVKKIHEGAYAYRIPFKSANELGQLSTSVNHALENLQELVIAQVVQDALLPDNLPGIAGYEIYAGTRPMTKLGGDYYDFFVNPSGELVVVMADVAGHGIQAALLMAMAKAAFMVGQTSEGTAMTIMHKLNQTFCHLRQSSVKTMLTCQVLSFLPDSGACALINAGHCPPLTISSDRQVTVHQFRTLPLGYSSSRTFEQMTITIASGDTLVLYSDGIIEALNDREEMLGQEGFVELVRASAHPDLKTFHAGMFARYDEWRAAQNDDITFVLIRRTADEN
jgi:sigma-B regulation protein RsbU (phosphoserine phosphatase)